MSAALRTCVSCRQTHTAAFFYGDSTRCKSCTFERKPEPKPAKVAVTLFPTVAEDKDGWPSAAWLQNYHKRVNHE